eukprot:snap_masked-scaffold_14-processed-gene-1.5-mRNA-1 protein AED:0.22 eAED:0.22 QI:0/-1/0/1/-1/1/1/0/4800
MSSEQRKKSKTPTSKNSIKSVGPTLSNQVSINLSILAQLCRCCANHPYNRDLELCGLEIISSLSISFFKSLSSTAEKITLMLSLLLLGHFSSYRFAKVLRQKLLQIKFWSEILSVWEKSNDYQTYSLILSVLSDFVFNKPNSAVKRLWGSCEENNSKLQEIYTSLIEKRNELSTFFSSYGIEGLNKDGKVAYLDFNLVSLKETETTRENFDRIFEKLEDRKPILIFGRQGSGKTVLINEIIHQVEHNLSNRFKGVVRINLYQEMEGKDLIGSFTYKVETSRFSFELGPLAKALIEGKIIVMEDVDLAPPEVFDSLVSVFDSREFTVQEVNETFQVHPAAQIFATYTVPLTSSETSEKSYARLRSLKSYKLFQEFWNIVEVKSLRSAELLDVCFFKFPGLSVFLLEKMAETFYIVKPFIEEQLSELKLFDARTISQQELFYWCRRVENFVSLPSLATRREKLFLTSDEKVDILFEFLDVFTAAYRSEGLNVLVSEKLCLLWGLSKGLLHTFAETREIKIERNSLGRLPVVRDLCIENLDIALTADTLKLVESVSSSALVNEPTLLVGESGTGKTLTVQQIANLFHKNLVVVNCHYQTETSDLFGAFKPIQIDSEAQKLFNHFKKEFDDFASADLNQDYINVTAKALSSKKYKKLVKCIQKFVSIQDAAAPLNKKKRKRPVWGNSKSQDSLSGLLNRFCALVNNPAKLRFDYEEGPLVQCMKNGDWIFLDEVNLAGNDVLERLTSVIDTNQRTFTLTERGDTTPILKHSEFRFFAAMNPGNDHGKKSLTKNFRSKFREILVTSNISKKQLLKVFYHYTQDLDVSKDFSNGVVECVLKLQARVELLKGSNSLDLSSLSTLFSLRTFSRALISGVKLMKSGFGFARGLYEAFVLHFLPKIPEHLSKPFLEIIKGYLVPEISWKQISLPPPCPKDGIVYKSHNSSVTKKQYLLFEKFWLRCNECTEVTEEDFIVTPHIKQYLQYLSSAVVVGKYPVLLEGPTSVGKTSMVKYLSRLTQNTVLRINNHEDTDISDYFGKFNQNETGSLTFQEGPLITAMRKGYWIILDELNLCSSEILESLNRILDDNKEAFIPQTQEKVIAHDNFMIFATQNPTSGYVGRKSLSKALRSRFVEIRVEGLPDKDIELIIERRCKLPPKIASLMASVKNEIGIRRQKSQVFRASANLLSVRELLKWGNRINSSISKLKENEVSYMKVFAQEGFCLLAEKQRFEEDKNSLKKILEEVSKVAIEENKFYQEEFSNLKSLTESGIIWTQLMKKIFVLVSKALENNEAVLLVGETGLGKTFLVQSIADIQRKKLRLVNCHRNSEASDFLGSLRPIRNKTGREDLDSQGLKKKILSLAQFLRSSKTCIIPPKLKKALVNITDIIVENKRVSSDIFKRWQRGLKILLGDESVPFSLSTRSEFEHLLHIKVSDLATADRLFEWKDGPLTSAMKEAGLFLLDEISLAEASVLERLNSVLEHSSEVFLAEKPASNAYVENTIKAQNGFGFIATMNPGGDFGKTELSPALRNRFTEIWVPANQSKGDLEKIIISVFETTSSNEAPSWTEYRAMLVRKMIVFKEYFENLLSGFKIRISIRDLKNWALFMQKCIVKASQVEKPSEDIFDFYFVEGARMIVLDGLGLGTSIPLAQINKLRRACLEKLSEICGSGVNSHFHDLYLKVQGLYPEPQAKGFSFSAPTTLGNLYKLLRGLMLENPILLEGTPSSGKTSIVEALGRMLKVRVIRINLSEQTDFSDLTGLDTPSSSEDGVSTRFSWTDGPIITAIKEGHWLLLDEVNLANQTVLEGLNACTDHRREIYLPDLDMSFKCHPRFRIFGTQNPVQLGGGRKGLPQSFLNRFTRVFVEELTKKDLIEISKVRFTHLGEDLLEKLVTFNEMLGASNQIFAGKGGSFVFNLRDLQRLSIMLYEQTYSISDIWQIVSLLYGSRLRESTDMNELLELFQKAFGVSEKELGSSLVRLIAAEGELHLQQGSLNFKYKLHGTIDWISNFSFSDLEMKDVFNAVACCVMNRWPCLVTGDRSTSFIHGLNKLSLMFQANVVQLDLSDASDLSDFIGSYQQLDPIILLKEVLLNIENLAVKYSSVEDLRVLKEQLVILNHLLEDTTIDETAFEIIKNDAKILLGNLNKEMKDSLAFKSLVSNLGQMRFDSQAFVWKDGVVTKAVKEGDWLVLRSTNKVSSSILDRLNSLLEPERTLSVSEGHQEDGNDGVLVAHPNFRIFLTYDPQFGEISSAMRNRCLEIYFPDISGDEKISCEERVGNDLGLFLEEIQDPIHCFLKAETKPYIGESLVVQAIQAADAITLRNLVNTQVPVKLVSDIKRDFAIKLDFLTLVSLLISRVLVGRINSSGREVMGEPTTLLDLLQQISKGKKVTKKALKGFLTSKFSGSRISLREGEDIIENMASNLVLLFGLKENSAFALSQLKMTNLVKFRELATYLTVIEGCLTSQTSVPNTPYVYSTKIYFLVERILELVSSITTISKKQAEQIQAQFPFIFLKSKDASNTTQETLEDTLLEKTTLVFSTKSFKDDIIHFPSESLFIAYQNLTQISKKFSQINKALKENEIATPLEFWNVQAMNNYIKNEQQLRVTIIQGKTPIIDLEFSDLKTSLYHTENLFPVFKYLYMDEELLYEHALHICNELVGGHKALLESSRRNWHSLLQFLLELRLLPLFHITKLRSWYLLSLSDKNSEAKYFVQSILFIKVVLENRLDRVQKGFERRNEHSNATIGNTDALGAASSIKLRLLSNSRYTQGSLQELNELLLSGFHHLYQEFRAEFSRFSLTQLPLENDTKRMEKATSSPGKFFRIEVLRWMLKVISYGIIVEKTSFYETVASRFLLLAYFKFLLVYPSKVNVRAEACGTREAVNDLQAVDAEFQSTFSSFVTGTKLCQLVNEHLGSITGKSFQSEIEHLPLSYMDSSSYSDLRNIFHDIASRIFKAPLLEDILHSNTSMHKFSKFDRLGEDVVNALEIVSAEERGRYPAMLNGLEESLELALLGSRILAAYLHTNEQSLTGKSLDFVTSESHLDVRISHELLPMAIDSRLKKCLTDFTPDIGTWVLQYAKQYMRHVDSSDKCTQLANGEDINRSLTREEEVEKEIKIMFPDYHSHFAVSTHEEDMVLDTTEPVGTSENVDKQSWTEFAKHLYSLFIYGDERFMQENLLRSCQPRIKSVLEFFRNTHDKPNFNMFTDPSWTEAKRLKVCVDKLILNVRVLQKEFPENQILLNIAKVAEKVLKTLSASPLYKILVGTEALLNIIDSWESVSASQYSLKEDKLSLVTLIISWRKLELDAFRAHFRNKSTLVKNETYPFVYDLLSLCSGKLRSSQFLEAISQFMRTSRLGDFEVRVNILYVAAELLSFVEIPRRKQQRNALISMHYYYTQFLASVKSTRELATETIVRQMDDFIRLAKWDERNKFSLKTSTQKSHRKLVTLARQFEEALKQPAYQVLEEHFSRNIITYQPIDKNSKSSSPIIWLTDIIKPKSVKESCLPTRAGILQSATVSINRFEQSWAAILEPMRLKEKILSKIEHLKNRNTPQVAKEKALSDLFKALKANGFEIEPTRLISHNETLKQSPLLDKEGAGSIYKASLKECNELFWENFGQSKQFLGEIAQGPSSENISFDHMRKAAGFVSCIFTLVNIARKYIHDSLTLSKRLEVSMRSFQNANLRQDGRTANKTYLKKLCKIMVQVVLLIADVMGYETEVEELLRKNEAEHFLKLYGSIYLSSLPKTVKTKVGSEYVEELKKHLTLVTTILTVCTEYEYVLSFEEKKGICEASDYVAGVLSVLDASPPTLSDPERHRNLVKQLKENLYSLNASNQLEIEASNFSAVPSKNPIEQASTPIKYPMSFLYRMVEPNIGRILQNFGKHIYEANLQDEAVVLSQFRRKGKDKSKAVDAMSEGLKNSNLTALCLIRFTNELQLLFKLVLRIFRTLYKNGFCKNLDEEDGSEVKESSAEGVGFGTGTGEQDVSNEIESEEQLIGTKDEEKIPPLDENVPSESKSSPPEEGSAIENLPNDNNDAVEEPENMSHNGEAEDDGIEMANDFSGGLNDVEQSDDEDENDDMDDLLDDLAKQFSNELEDEMTEVDEMDGDRESQDGLEEDNALRSEREGGEVEDEFAAGDGDKHHKFDEVEERQEDSAVEESEEPAKENNEDAADDSKNFESKEKGEQEPPKETGEVETENEALVQEDADDAEVVEDKHGEISDSCSEREEEQSEGDVDDCNSETQEKLGEENPDQEVGGQEEQLGQEENLQEIVEQDSYQTSGFDAFGNEEANDTERDGGVNNIDKVDANEGDGNENQGTQAGEENGEVGGANALERQFRDTINLKANPWVAEGDADKSLEDDLEVLDNGLQEITNEQQIRENGDNNENLAHEFSKTGNTGEDQQVLAETHDPTVKDQTLPEKPAGEVKKKEEYKGSNRKRSSSQVQDDRMQETQTKRPKSSFEENLNNHVEEVDLDAKKLDADSVSFDPNVVEEQKDDSQKLISDGQVQRLSTAVSEVETDCVDLPTTNPNPSGLSWSKALSLTIDSSYSLSENLKIILAANVANRLKGDYKTGKKLNIRRLISYIASNYEKDRIWMKKKKLSRREYQVGIAIDNSLSMQKSKDLCVQSLALLNNTFLHLELGNLGVTKFGKTCVTLKKIQDNSLLSEPEGEELVRSLDFSEHQTRIDLALEQILDSFKETKNLLKEAPGNSETDFRQLVFILSDGKFDSGYRSKIQSLAERAEKENQFIVLVILDEDESLLKAKKVHFVRNEVVVERYLENYPFPYYMVLQDIEKLPETLSEALKQWFEAIQ